jgi:hypothetical protein
MTKEIINKEIIIKETNIKKINIKEIIIKEPLQENFYHMEHNMNCYPIVHTSDKKDHGVNYDDKNHLYLARMKGFTGKIVLVE